MVKDSYPQSGPVVRFLLGEPLAGAAVSEEPLLPGVSGKGCVPAPNSNFV